MPLVPIVVAEALCRNARIPVMAVLAADWKLVAVNLLDAVARFLHLAEHLQLTQGRPLLRQAQPG